MQINTKYSIFCFGTKSGAIYMATKEAVPIIQALEEMGHPQHSSGVPITTDNLTAHGILNNTMQAKLSKA